MIRTRSEWGPRNEEPVFMEGELTIWPEYLGPFGQAQSCDYSYDYVTLPDGRVAQWDMMFCEYIIRPPERELKDPDPNDNTPALEGALLLGDYTKTRRAGNGNFR